MSCVRVLKSMYSVIVILCQLYISRLYLISELQTHFLTAYSTSLYNTEWVMGNSNGSCPKSDFCSPLQTCPPGLLHLKPKIWESFWIHSFFHSYRTFSYQQSCQFYLQNVSELDHVIPFLNYPFKSNILSIWTVVIKVNFLATLCFHLCSFQLDYFHGSQQCLIFAASQVAVVITCVWTNLVIAAHSVITSVEL